jgi:hypothetical protein
MRAARPAHVLRRDDARLTIAIAAGAEAGSYKGSVTEPPPDWDLYTSHGLRASLACFVRDRRNSAVRFTRAYLRRHLVAAGHQIPSKFAAT